MNRVDVDIALNRADGGNDRRAEYLRLQVLLLSEVLEELKLMREASTPTPDTVEMIRANKSRKK